MNLPKLCKELRAGLEGVTPITDGDLMRYEHGGGRLAVIRDGERKLVADFYHEADREHYTRCSPENISALLDERDRLREALVPFAEDAGRWAEDVPDEHRSLCTEPGKTHAHFGSETVFTVGDLRRARAALKGAADD